MERSDSLCSRVRGKVSKLCWLREGGDQARIVSIPDRPPTGTTRCLHRRDRGWPPAVHGLGSIQGVWCPAKDEHAGFAGGGIHQSRGAVGGEPSLRGVRG